VKEKNERAERARNIKRIESEWDAAASSTEEGHTIKRWLRLAKELFDKDDDPTPSAA
jgi:hypothetical protein